MRNKHIYFCISSSVSVCVERHKRIRVALATTIPFFFLLFLQPLFFPSLALQLFFLFHHPMSYHNQMYASPPPPPPHHQQSMMSPPPMRQSPYPPSPFDPHSRQSLEDVGDTERAMGWHGSNQRASMSDVKLTGGGHHYDSDDDDMLMVPQEQRKRRTCMDKVCCGCCTCYPRWLRYICCVIFLLVIALAIVIGVLAATFKVPDVSMNGLEGEPQVSMTGETVNMNFTLAISVDNPNVEGITFEKIEAKVCSMDDLLLGMGAKNEATSGGYSDEGLKTGFIFWATT